MDLVLVFKVTKPYIFSLGSVYLATFLLSHLKQCLNKHEHLNM